MEQIEGKVILYEPEEDDLELEELYKYCHCCMKQTENLKGMFNESMCDGEYEKYSEMLRACFSIQVETWTDVEDDSKVMICDECVVKLRGCLSFRQQVEHTQWRIRKMSKAMRSDTSLDGDDSSDEKIIEKEEKTSDDILNNAISRTRKNLQLLKQNDQISSDTDIDNNEMERRIKQAYYASNNKPYEVVNGRVVCKLCNESFLTRTKLTNHMTQHFPFYSCKQCDKSFITNALLRFHVQRVHDMEKIECGICEQTFKKTSLKRHIATHTGNTYRHDCKYCSESFTAYGACIKHMIRIHKYKGSRFKCKECPKVFFMSGDLNKHVRQIHLRENRYQCTECDMSFFTSYLLKIHMVKHTGARNFQCDVCKNTFCRKQVLVEHMKTHSKVKNYPCTICNKSFTQKWSLDYHCLKKHDVDEMIILTSET